MLISVDQYQSITGDVTSASAVVETALEDAQSLLEDRIGRGLEMVERTERVRVFPDGIVYPAVTPLVTVPAGASIQGSAVSGGTPAGSFLTPADDHSTLTYTGGYDPDETDRSAATYVPVELARAIAWAARAIISPASFGEVPAGATSVTVGDVSLSWGPGGSPAQGEVVFSSGLLRRWRRRRDLAA